MTVEVILTMSRSPGCHLYLWDCVVGIVLGPTMYFLLWLKVIVRAPSNVSGFSTEVCVTFFFLHGVSTMFVSPEAFKSLFRNSVDSIHSIEYAVSTLNHHTKLIRFKGSCTEFVNTSREFLRELSLLVNEHFVFAQHGIP